MRSDSLPVPAPAPFSSCLLYPPSAELRRGSAQWRLHQPQQPQPAAIQTLRPQMHQLWSNAFIYHLPRRTFPLSATAALVQRAGSDSLGPHSALALLYVPFCRPAAFFQLVGRDFHTFVNAQSVQLGSQHVASANAGARFQIYVASRLLLFNCQSQSRHPCWCSAAR